MEKIKPNIINWLGSEKGKDILVIIIIILVGLGSFELGRLSKSDRNSGIKIEHPTEVTNQEANIISATNYSSILQKTEIEKTATTKNFFASSRGRKYYPVGCSAGNSLKLENRIYFATKEEAERAGYELSSACR